MKVGWVSALFLLGLAGVAGAEERREFVKDGVATGELVFRGAEWKTGDGTLTGAGVGQIAMAGVELLPGDFEIRAELRITGLEKSAASFVLGGSHFGFEGGNGEMFTEGALFGGIGSRDLGKPVIEEGKLFRFEAVRREGRFRISIDGRELLMGPAVNWASLAFGFRPHRATMHLQSFSATGTFREFPKPIPHTTVYARGEGAYHTYRIPAAVVTKKGTLLAFCEGRKDGGGDAGNIDLLLRRSLDNGETWSEPIVVWDDGANTCGNPCPVVDQETGTIWLLLTGNLGSDHERDIMKGTSEQPRHVYVSHSEDDGVTWAAPVKISDTTRREHWRWYATGPGNAIQLTRGAHKGRLVIPCNHSDHSDPDKHPYRSHVIFSDDHGASWKLGGVHEDKTNESAVVELRDGSLLQAMRSYHGTNRRAMAVSGDGGETWGRVTLDEALDTPVCQASILRYSWPEDGKSRILFSSPHGSGRAKMTVWMSHDEGKTWPVRKLIHEGGGAYSNLVALPDGRVGLLYEKDGYASISFTTFSIGWLSDGKDEVR